MPTSKAAAVSNGAAAAKQPKRRRARQGGQQQQQSVRVAPRLRVPKVKTGPVTSNVLSPWSHGNVPMVRSVAPCIPVHDLVSEELTLATGTRVIYCISNIGASAAVMLKFDQTGGVVTTAVSSCPTLLADHTGGGPIRGRAMKAGVSVVNVTSAINAGGRVYVLPADQRVNLPAAPSAMTSANFDTLADSLKSSLKKQSYGGADLMHNNCWISGPADVTDYEDFVEWKTPATADEFAQHCCAWSGGTTNSRPMTSIWLLLESPGATQAYTITARASYYLRFAQGTLLGNQMTHASTMSTAEMNRQVRQATSGMSKMHTAGMHSDSFFAKHPSLG